MPATLVLVVLTQLRRITWASDTTAHGIVAATVVGLLGCAGLGAVIALGYAVLLMGAVLLAALTVYLVRSRRPRVTTPGRGDTAAP